MKELARTPKQLGSILRRRRVELGLTQQTLASRIALRQATVSDLETSVKNTRIATLFSALAALNLEIVIRIRTKSSNEEIEAMF